MNTESQKNAGRQSGLGVSGVTTTLQTIDVLLSKGFWQSIIGADEGLPVEDASLTGFSQFSKLLKIKGCWIRSVTGQRSNQLRYTPQNTRIVALLSS